MVRFAQATRAGFNSKIGSLQSDKRKSRRSKHARIIKDDFAKAEYLFRLPVKNGTLPSKKRKSRRSKHARIPKDGLAGAEELSRLPESRHKWNFAKW